MTAPLPIVRFGTRGSALARWQTEYVRALLQAAWPHLCAQVQVISTYGDRVVDTPLPVVGGKGVFTAELEAALLSGAVDLATHSLKDLPTQLLDGLAIGAVPRRANPADVLVSRGSYTLDTLPRGATVGTSSRRRAAQLLYRRPDLRIADIRGNVDTRINKALDPTGPYDAILLAYAGLQRLESLDVVCQVLALDQMLPAPGQGALGIQCRDEPLWLELVASINHRETAIAVTAERAFLAGLGGGCAVPIAAHATTEDTHLALAAQCQALQRRWTELHMDVLQLDQEWQRLLETVNSRLEAAKNGQPLEWADGAFMFVKLKKHTAHLSDVVEEALQTCGQYAKTLQRALDDAQQREHQTG